MKTKLFMIAQAVLLLGVGLCQAHNAMAFTQESILKRPAAHNKWNSMSNDQKKSAAKNAQSDWNKLSPSQQQQAKSAENNRLHRLYNENH